jgi:hypothetical protein
MKEEQSKFSLEDYIAHQAQQQIAALPVAESRQEKLEQEKVKAQIDRRVHRELATNKQKLKEERFGYLNWIVASAFIMLALFTGLTVFASDMTKYRQISEQQRLQEQRGRVSSTTQSSSSSSESSEASEEETIVDSDGDGIPDDQDPTPNGEEAVVDSDGDGIPDAEDPTPNGEILPPIQSVVDSDGDGIPDDQDPTPYGEPAVPETNIPDTTPTAPETSEVPSGADAEAGTESVDDSSTVEERGETP